ncbi:MAG TPA: DUF4287 domain-containing protein [Caulobacteraceae bacterium]|jgi:hypothetical protein|nr:DUF4287 domain-containing protein [Caulobacteraceae bacterium]
MPEPDPPKPNLTERQQKWFATVRAGLERDTGRTMAQWVAIARSCPEEGHRARLKWLKDNHGLLQNRASQVLSEAFGSPTAWREPDGLIEALWADPSSRAIFQAIDAAARQPDGVIRTARKGYTAWSRKVQFAAARPVRGGKAMLGLAVTPEAGPRLQAAMNESWSERLKARTLLASPAEVDDEIGALLREAWERS